MVVVVVTRAPREFLAGEGVEGALFVRYSLQLLVKIDFSFVECDHVS